MKHSLCILYIILFHATLNIHCVYGQSLYFPPLIGTQWDTIHPSTLNWCSNKLDSLQQYLQEKNTKAFIVLKNGKIVLEWYYDTFTQDSVWYWASAGKTITASLIGIAQEEGFLNIYDTTSSYLGDGWTSCSVLEEDNISIWNQLTMTSGLDDGVLDTDCTLDTCLQCIANSGTRWAYHNAPYTLLEQVLSSATGSTLNQYYSQKIGSKIGAYGLFVPIAYNQVFFSTARSMARFGLLILANGTWNGNKIIQDSVYFQNMINTSQTLNKSYGYLWWLNGKGEYMLPQVPWVFNTNLIPNAPADLIAGLGKYDQKLYVIPSQNMVVIRMGNEAGLPSFALSSFDNELWEKITDLTCVSTSVQHPSNLTSSLNVYPNPFTQKIHIHHNFRTNSFIEIFNNLGNKVFTCNSCDEINTQSWSTGVYYIQITSNLSKNTYILVK